MFKFLRFKTDIVIIYLILVLFVLGIFGFSFRVFAATSMYDFSSNAGVDKWAYRKQGSQPSDPSDYDTEALSGEYNAISSSDDSRWELLLPPPNQWNTHIFTFTINENINNITSLDFEWEGYGGIDQNAVTYFYIWNRNTNNWEELDSKDFTQQIDDTLLGNITTNIADYIDPTTKHLTIMVSSPRPGLSLGESCGSSGECISGYCVDGVCCDGPCTGDCEACSGIGSDGYCTVRPVNQNIEVSSVCYYCDGVSTSSVPYTGDEGVNCTGDCTHCVSGSCENWPNNEQHEGCTGICRACQNGSCGYATAGTDPGNQCDITMSCINECTIGQTTGNCDGAGSCESSGATTYVRSGYVCTGAGQETPVSPSAYCNYDEDCDDGDCSATEWFISCNGSGSCRAPTDHTDAYSRAVYAQEGYTLTDTCGTTGIAVCGYSDFNACTGEGSPYTCQKQRDKLRCDASHNCAYDTGEDDVVNIAAGYVCIGAGQEATGSDTYYSSLSSFNGCVGACQKKRDKLACDGSGGAAGPDVGDSIAYLSTSGKVCSAGSEINPSSSIYCDRTIDCVTYACSAQRYYRGCLAGSSKCTDAGRVRYSDWYAFPGTAIAETAYKVGDGCITTIEIGCAVCKTCGGSGRCDVDVTSNWGSNYYMCTGSNARCYQGVCRVCEGNVYFYDDGCNGCAGQGGKACWRMSAQGGTCEGLCSNYGGCVQANWNDDNNCTVCCNLGGCSLCHSNGVNAAQPMVKADAWGNKECWARDSSYSQSCNASVSGYWRYCVCQY